MIEEMADEMSDWASARGLRFLGERELPATTTFLRQGLGVGEHRSTLVLTGSERWYVEKGWERQRPERATLNLCEGRLPGGLTGAIGHHVYLRDHGRGNEGGRYLAYVATAVYAGGLATGELELASWNGESRERMESFATPEVRDALVMLPEETQAEYESGRICVSIRDCAVTDGMRLDALCRLASGLAKGMIAPVGSEAPSGREESSRANWMTEGAGLIEWPVSPGLNA